MIEDRVFFSEEATKVNATSQDATPQHNGKIV